MWDRNLSDDCKNYITIGKELAHFVYVFEIKSETEKFKTLMQKQKPLIATGIEFHNMRKTHYFLFEWELRSFCLNDSDSETIQSASEYKDEKLKNSPIVKHNAGNVEKNIGAFRKIFLQIRKNEEISTALNGHFIKLVNSLNDAQIDEIELMLPEDDLNNRLVGIGYNKLEVDRPKLAKEKRQLIVAHNANIPVNGEVEYINSMDSILKVNF